MKWRRVLAGSLGLTLLLLGHFWFWYQPRPRPQAPDPASKLAGFLDSHQVSLSFWIPYPHQNLPILLEELGLNDSEDSESQQRALTALAELVGGSGQSFPSFGPLGLPPSHELAYAALPHGQGRLLTARVYPGMSLFARLAGWLADNPWLRGGQIEVDQQPAWTAWQGFHWSVTEAGATELNSSVLEHPWMAPGIAFFNWRQESEIVPIDQYRLLRNPLGLVLESRSAPPEIPLAPRELRDHRAAVWLREESVAGQRSLLVFAQDENHPQEMPRAVSILQPGPPTGNRPQHFSLPGESLLGLSGRAPLVSEIPPAQIMALDRQSLQRAEDLLSVLQTKPNGSAQFRLFWLDLEAAHRETQRVAEMMRSLPLIPAHHAQRWQSIADLCRPLADRFSELTITISDEPDGLRLQLTRREL